jgi:hypothetical protein
MTNNKMKHTFVAALAGLFLCSATFAQEFSAISQSTIIGRNMGYPTGTPRPDWPENLAGNTPVGNLDFVFETAVFAKDLEFDGKVKGQTFIGFLAPVRLRYRVHEQVTIEAGAVLGHNFGDKNSLDVVEPLVRLVYEPKNNLFVIAGTIIPTHWIHDALLDDLQKFRQPAEQGFQFRADRAHWKNDTWINWRVREGSFNGEKFEVGNATQLRWWGARGDLQVLDHHTGGQNYQGPHTTLNQIAGYAGGSFGTQGTDWFAQDSWIQDIRVHGGYFVSSDSALADKHGTGWEIGASADLQVCERALVHPFVSYFRGDNFSAVRGDILYSNYKRYAQGGVNLVFKLPAGLCAEAGLVMQPSDNDLNYSFQINLVWGRGFKLLTPK